MKKYMRNYMLINRNLLTERKKHLTRAFPLRTFALTKNTLEMANEIEKLKQKIADTENVLNDYKTALRVILSLEEKDTIIKSVILAPAPDPSIRKTTVREYILSDIKNGTGDISTNYLVQKHVERTGHPRNKASNTICPSLSNLAKAGIIESYKPNPKMAGNCWRIKQNP